MAGVASARWVRGVLGGGGVGPVVCTWSPRHPALYSSYCSVTSHHYTGGPSHHGGHTPTLGYPGWSPLSPSPSLSLSAEVFLNQLRTPAPSVWPQPPWWPHPHPRLPRVVSPLPFTFTPPGAPQVSWICLYCNGWLPETSANLEVNIDCFGMNKDTDTRCPRCLRNRGVMHKFG